MVILHVVAPCDVGGLERVVQLLAREQASAGHQVHVAAILTTGSTTAHPFFAPLAETGVVTHAIVPGPRGYRRERHAVAALCGLLRPAVVHTHGYRPDVLDSGVARRAGCRVVTTVHGFTGGDWKNRVYEWLQCRSYPDFDAVVAVSRALRARLVGAGVPAERIHVVPNAWREADAGLDREAARHALGLPPAGIVVGWVGRVSHEKGADVLIDALGRLEDVPLVASIIGDGPARRRLEERAGRLRLDGRVRWHGSVPGAAALFRAFDVFVLSSRTEGSPIVVFEAMAAGVPIIATSVGGVPDMVSPHEAVLVPPEHPAALAAAIRAASCSPAAMQVRAQHARERLRRDFGPERWAARYEGIYRGVGAAAPATVSA